MESFPTDNKSEEERRAPEVVYQTMNGEVLSNPNDTLTERNKPVLNTYRAKLNHEMRYPRSLGEAPYMEIAKQYKEASGNVQKVDYDVRSPSFRTTGVSLWGKKTTQEDRVSVGRLNGYSQLSETNQKNVLNQTATLLQQHITELGIGHSTASTMSAVVMTKDKVFVAQIGDSVAYLDSVNSATNESRVQPLFTQQFHPKSKRLMDPKKLELTGIGLTNALGGNGYEDVGLRHEATINVYPIAPKPNEKFLIVNTSDGLTEREEDAFVPPKMTEILAKSTKDPISVVTNKLAQGAVEAESQDNITFTVTEFDPTASEASYSVVFDGNGGDEVANAANELFEPIMQNQILFAKLLEQNPDLETEIKQLEKNLHELMRNQSVTQIKAIYQQSNQALKAVINTNELVGSTNKKQILESIDKYTSLILIEETAKKTHPDLSKITHDFPNNIRGSFVANSQPIFTSALEMVSTGNVEGIRQKRRELVAYHESLGVLINAILTVKNVRHQYDPHMPPSWTPEFASYKAKGAEERKQAIRLLENGLLEGMNKLASGKSSMYEVLDGLRKSMINIRDKTQQHHVQDRNAMTKFVFDIFPAKETKSDLVKALDSAITQVSKLMENLPKPENYETNQLRD